VRKPVVPQSTEVDAKETSDRLHRLVRAVQNRSDAAVMAELSVTPIEDMIVTLLVAVNVIGDFVDPGDY